MSYWLEHFKAFEQSGLTQAAYCQKHELNAKHFSSRLAIYRETQASVIPSLIPVQVEGLMSEPICLHHAKGHRLELPPSISASWLAELLRGLE
jgi:hypothetical protein